MDGVFKYIGPHHQVYKVKPGVKHILAEICGASGGDSSVNFGNKGGLGGCITTSLEVEPDQTLYVFVGGQGGVMTGGW